MQASFLHATPKVDAARPAPRKQGCPRWRRPEGDTGDRFVIAIYSSNQILDVSIQAVGGLCISPFLVTASWPAMLPSLAGRHAFFPKGVGSFPLGLGKTSPVHTW